MTDAGGAEAQEPAGIPGPHAAALRFGRPASLTPIGHAGGRRARLILAASAATGSTGTTTSIAGEDLLLAAGLLWEEQGSSIRQMA